jgi:hypothetical protein
MLGRFTGWTRIGIVLSVAWALVVLVWAVSDLRVASHLVDGLYAKCISFPKGNPDSCELMAESLRESAYMNITGRVLWPALVLVPAAWALVPALLVLVRWVRRGSRPCPSAQIEGSEKTPFSLCGTRADDLPR